MNMSLPRRKSYPTSPTTCAAAPRARNGAHRKLLCSFSSDDTHYESAIVISLRRQETVQCDRCKKFFHMVCVNPPLSSKPSRGYGWTCAPCSREHEEEVDSQQIMRHQTPLSSKPKSNAPAPRGRGRPRKDRMQAEKEENMEIKHFKMWPFRYFGYGRFIYGTDATSTDCGYDAASTLSLRTRWVSESWVAFDLPQLNSEPP
jgi:hypothetical protein